MARKVGSDATRTLAAIKRAAIEHLYTFGYEAMSLRTLAHSIDLQPGSLYNYFRTKEDLLESLLKDHMMALIAAAEAALATASTPSPMTALETLIEFHVRYYASKRKDVYVANSELRSLKGEAHTRVVALRRRYEELWVNVLLRAAATGSIRATDPRVTAFAIIAMLTGLCTWYSEDGRLPLDTVVDIHRRLILRGLAAHAEEDA
jgi:AcrR family transcriptional regulator